MSPKPPTAGSKILLERITPLWNRLSFTKKVTTRNIFRYKKRMAMTIFGVAGSVALLVAGFGVQHSISGINERQFEDLMTYNMIVAKNDYVTEEQDEELNHLFARDDIKEHVSVYYEELYKTAGDQKNRQEITLLVPENKEQFNTYTNLLNRSTQEEIVFGEENVIISERLAELLEVTKGDFIQVQDGTYRDYEMIVSDITEMYMGHFIFMTPENYKNIFSNEFESNAKLVKLKDSSEANVKKLSAEFMTTDGVSGVVQNTTLSTQIETIVDSLDKIMMVLILVAILLAIVILYNLININVSERIRELSTIKVLGFYDKEVTLYIYREIIILALFGIFVGFGIGTWLHSYILTAVPPDNVMLNLVLWNYSYVIPLFITMFVVMLLGFNVNKRLKNVDMLETLKSVE